MTDSATLTGAPPPTAGLYDSARDLFYAKPVLRGWMHLLWFEASLVVGTLLITASRGAVEISAVAVYVASVSCLFGVSALYHRGTWSPRNSMILQRLDHTMIFFLIAGTATPAFLIAGGTYGVVCMIVLSTLTVTATVIHLAWMSAPEKLVGTTFLALGWLAGMAIPAVWINAGVAPAVLMLTGGLLYTAGAISYHRRRPDPLPAVFGYHEVFHAFVCVAAACEYVAVTLLVV
ncbi:MAG: PAQR family membrane homeostasis protein TrhA [Jatrophihabitans sp.]